LGEEESTAALHELVINIEKEFGCLKEGERSAAKLQAFKTLKKRRKKRPFPSFHETRQLRFFGVAGLKKGTRECQPPKIAETPQPAKKELAPYWRHFKKRI